MINETDYTSNLLPKEQENKIDTIFAQYDTTDKPGCAVGVIQDGRFMYKKCFGMANLDYDIPITSDSKFNIGSVSKQFTAACICLLVLENKLSLNDDVRKYIPELPDYGKLITIRHLLHHTSGLRDYLDMTMLNGTLQFDSYINDKYSIQILCKQSKLNFAPGEKQFYSNSGYLLLVEIVSRITGKSFREFAEANILKPLDMNDTIYVDDCKAIVKNKVISYDISGKVIHFELHNYDSIGGGGFISTLNDLRKWNNNFYNPIVGGQNLLDLMFTRSTLDSGEILNYCFGLTYETINNKLSIGHAGHIGNFSSNFIHFLESKTDIIILCNRGDIDVFSKVNSIAEIVLPDNSQKNTEPDKIDCDEPALFLLNESDMKIFCGDYWSEDSKLKRKIYLKDGNLFYFRYDNNESKLTPIGINEFYMDNNRNLILRFETQSSQNIMRIIENKRCTATFISYDPIAYTLDELKNFCGNYYSVELCVVYQLKLESNKLTLFINDRKISELKEVMKNLFEVIEWGTLIKFRTNLDKVSGLETSTERAKEIDFIKQ